MAKNYTDTEVTNRVFWITMIGCVLFCGTVIIFVL